MKKKIEFNLEIWNKKGSLTETRLVTKSGEEVHILASNVKIEGKTYLAGYTVSSFGTIRSFIWTYHGKPTVTFSNNSYDLYIEIEEECSFEPFQKVLTRDNVGLPWQINYFSHMDKGDKFKCMCVMVYGNIVFLTTKKPKDF